MFSQELYPKLRFVRVLASVRAADPESASESKRRSRHLWTRDSFHIFSFRPDPGSRVKSLSNPHHIGGIAMCSGL